MFHNAISLKLVVQTYMGGSTPVYNGKKILGVFLTAIWLPHSQLWRQLQSPKVNHCVLHFQCKGHQEPPNEIESLSLAECLVGFALRTFWFLLQCLNPLAHSPQQFPWSFLLYNISLTRSLKSQQYRTYNPGHNILELCNILVQIRFTTSKRKVDI